MPERVHTEGKFIACPDTVSPGGPAVRAYPAWQTADNMPGSGGTSRVVRGALPGMPDHCAAAMPCRRTDRVPPCPASPCVYTLCAGPECLQPAYAPSAGLQKAASDLPSHYRSGDLKLQVNVSPPQNVRAYPEREILPGPAGETHPHGATPGRALPEAWDVTRSAINHFLYGVWRQGRGHCRKDGRDAGTGTSGT